MADDPNVEKSESGAPVFRHNNPLSRDVTSSDGSSMEAICDHFTKHVGKVTNVFHEIVSDLVHIDVHYIPPTQQRNYFTLFTTGMSDLPMKAPAGAEHLKYAEVFIHLPNTWKLDGSTNNDESNYWPIRWLKTIARLPHQYNTWLGLGHSVPNGDPAKPFAKNTKFDGIVLLEPMLIRDEEFQGLAASEDKTIWFYNMVPLYHEEMDYKLRHGLGLYDDQVGLGERLQDKKTGVSPSDLYIVNNKRRNVITGRTPGLFG